MYFNLLSFLPNVFFAIFYASAFMTCYEQFNAIWLGGSPDKEALLTMLAGMVTIGAYILSIPFLVQITAMLVLFAPIFLETYLQHGMIPNVGHVALGLCVLLNIPFVSAMAMSLKMFLSRKGLINNYEWETSKNKKRVSIVKNLGDIVLLYVAYALTQQLILAPAITLQSFVYPVVFIVYLLNSFGFVPQYTRKALSNLSTYAMSLVQLLRLGSYSYILVPLVTVIQIPKTLYFVKAMRNFCTLFIIVPILKITDALKTQFILANFSIIKSNIPAKNKKTSMAKSLQQFLSQYDAQVYHVNPESWQYTPTESPLPKDSNLEECYQTLKEQLETQENTLLDKINTLYQNRNKSTGIADTGIYENYLHRLFYLAITDEQARTQIFTSLKQEDVEVCPAGKVDFVIKLYNKCSMDSPTLEAHINHYLAQDRQLTNDSMYQMTYHVASSIDNDSLYCTLFRLILNGLPEDRHSINAYFVHFCKRYQSAGYNIACQEAKLREASLTPVTDFCNMLAPHPNEAFYKNDIEQLFAEDTAFRYSITPTVLSDFGFTKPPSLAECILFKDLWEQYCPEAEEEERTAVDSAITKFNHKESLTDDEESSIKSLYTDIIMALFEENNKPKLLKFLLFYYGHIVPIEDVHEPSFLLYAQEFIKNLCQSVVFDSVTILVAAAKNLASIALGLIQSPFYIAYYSGAKVHQTVVQPIYSGFVAEPSCQESRLKHA